MTKISNIILLLLAGISLNLEGMELKRTRSDEPRKPDLIIRRKIGSSGPDIIRPTLINKLDKFEKSPETPINKFISKLIDAINNENFDAVEDLIKNMKESNIDLNALDSKGNPSLYYIYNEFMIKPSHFKLKVIEYLIQNGIDLNNTSFEDISETGKIIKSTPLEAIINSMSKFPYKEEKINYFYKFISLLLDYGENITNKAIELAENSRYRNELFKIFGLIKFQESELAQERLPLELVEHVKKFIPRS